MTNIHYGIMDFARQPILSLLKHIIEKRLDEIVTKEDYRNIYKICGFILLTDFAYIQVGF